MIQDVLANVISRTGTNNSFDFPAASTNPNLYTVLGNPQLDTSVATGRVKTDASIPSDQYIAFARGVTPSSIPAADSFLVGFQGSMPFVAQTLNLYAYFCFISVFENTLLIEGDTINLPDNTKNRTFLPAQDSINGSVYGRVLTSAQPSDLSKTGVQYFLGCVIHNTGSGAVTIPAQTLWGLYVDIYNEDPSFFQPSK